jgi:hypothetical protein
MDITEKHVEASFNYFSKLAMHLVPGLVALEVTFRKGLFAGGIADVYAFVLLLVWAAILSLPFEACTFSIGPLLRRWQTSFFDNEEALRSWRSYGRSQIQFLFELPLVAFYYFLNRLCMEFGVASPVQRYLASLTMLFLLSWPLAWLFTLSWRALAPQLFKVRSPPPASTVTSTAPPDA